MIFSLNNNDAKSWRCHLAVLVYIVILCFGEFCITFVESKEEIIYHNNAVLINDHQQQQQQRFLRNGPSPSTSKSGTSTTTTVPVTTTTFTFSEEQRSLQVQQRQQQQLEDVTVKTVFFYAINPLTAIPNETDYENLLRNTEDWLKNDLLGSHFSHLRKVQIVMESNQTTSSYQVQISTNLIMSFDPNAGEEVPSLVPIKAILHNMDVTPYIQNYLWENLNSTNPFWNTYSVQIQTRQNMQAPISPPTAAPVVPPPTLPPGEAAPVKIYGTLGFNFFTGYDPRRKPNREEKEEVFIPDLEAFITSQLISEYPDIHLQTIVSVMEVGRHGARDKDTITVRVELDNRFSDKYGTDGIIPTPNELYIYMASINYGKLVTDYLWKDRYGYWYDVNQVSWKT